MELALIVTTDAKAVSAAVLAMVSPELTVAGVLQCVLPSFAIALPLQPV